MKRGLLLPAIATLFSLLVLIGLGFWQWQRMAQKEALISTIAARTAMTPQPLPEGAAATQNAEYLPVTVTGKYTGGPEAHVFFSLAKKTGGASGPGYLVMAPFELEDGRVVLVNRGFVPQHLKAPASRPGTDVSGPATITGLIRLPERRNAFTGTDDVTKNIYYTRDPVTIARGLGLTGQVLPFLIDLKAPSPAVGLPVPGVTQIDIPNNHFQYALTWWSLALVLAVMFVLFARQRRSAT